LTCRRARCGCWRGPEPIEAVAEVPDGPPLRFRWRRALHEWLPPKGRNAIEGAWWSEHGGPARDYFRVEDQKRASFLAASAPGSTAILAHGAGAPAWFLHGTFA
jgi:protein ImuB